VTHLNDDELILYYYREHGRRDDVERHLRSCARCASSYDALAATLRLVVAAEPRELDDAFRLELRDALRRRIAENDQLQWIQSAHAGRVELGLAALAWLIPLVYPFSFAAIFRSAQLSREFPAIGMVLTVLAVLWATAGPAVAVFVLGRSQTVSSGGVRHRLVMYGAFFATVSPALFNLTSRTGFGLPMWYGAAAAGSLLALVPISGYGGPTGWLRRLHRFSALWIVIFAFAHIGNQAFALISIPTHTTVQSVLRLGYRQPIIELLLLAAIVIQVATGATIWRATASRLERGSASANLQAVSGLYLAAFFLAHVSATLLARQHHTETDFVWAAGRAGLLAGRGSASQLPYYLLGIVSLFVHVGAYAQVKAADFLPDMSVRRLSYAAFAVAATLVVGIGLALCGIHLVP
jgi:hypothetical protein